MGKDDTEIRITNTCSIPRNINAPFVTQEVYGEPYCPRTASNCDASCPRCKRAVLFEVFSSRHKERGGKVYGLGIFFRHYLRLWIHTRPKIVYWNIKIYDAGPCSVADLTLRTCSHSSQQILRVQCGM